MKKILVIDSSELLRLYIKEKLEQYNFEVVLAKDGFEGLIKIKNELPDLIIMDFYLNRVSGLDILKEKHSYKSATNIPVIMLSSKIDRDLITKISRYKVYRFLTKPIRIDILVDAISELFGKRLAIDETPCILDVHLNDDIFFIEVASGLNKDKIDILKYKIMQIKELHKIELKKVLIMFSDITFNENFSLLLNKFLETVVELTDPTMKLVKILTNSDVIKDLLSVHEKYKFIQVTDDFIAAMDSFGKIDAFAFGEELENIKQDLIINKVKPHEPEDTIGLKFDSEKLKIRPVPSSSGKFKIAIIDDDLSILEFIATVLSDNPDYEISTYENAKYFLQELDKKMPDLIFLDIMMPEMNGFQIMSYLKDSNLDIPIVIITAMTNKEAVIKAHKFGVKTYMTKPLKIDLLLKKADEILRSDF
jgi:DNA-binding response OmpR family regulator